MTASRIHDIGIGANKTKEPKAFPGSKEPGAPRAGEEMMMREEVQACWINTSAGRRMALYRAVDPTSFYWAPSDKRKKDEFQQTAERMEHASHAPEMEFVEMVDKDLENVAASIHKQKWGFDPVYRTAGPHEQMRAVADAAKDLAKDEAEMSST